MSTVKIQGHASGSGTLTVTAPNTSTNRTLTLPDTTGTLLDENSSLPAANLTGTVADARISALTSSKLTGNLPALNASSLTNIPAANITGTLPAISGASLTGITTGKVLQVVSMNYSGESSTTSSSFVDTGLTLAITPSATSSKIFITCNQNSCRAVANTVNIQMQLIRDSSVITLFEKECALGTVNEIQAYGTNYLDSPSTTSAVTYKVQVLKASGSGSLYWNSGGSKSTITLMEIAG